jgi:coatomer subunit beta
VPSVLANLDHRHSYVRRNAVLAVNAIYKLPKGELMLQDAPEMIEKFLQQEQDTSGKRNAFAMLANHAQDRAVRYLFENIEQLVNWGDILQMSVLELIRKARAAAGGQPGATPC